MNRYEDLRVKIEDWADKKGIFENGTQMAQAIKTLEEADELLEAIDNYNKEEIIDALGDVLVTIIIQARMQNLNLLDCLESAYNVISKRNGRMVNGKFVKEEGPN